MQYLETDFGKLAYKKYGNGQCVHLLFHGFGQSMKSMSEFLKLKRPGDSFYFFDIYFHGNSNWKNSKGKLDKNKWKSVIEALKEKEAFDQFHLIGYSMGGKFSLITFELYPEHVLSLTLMAPDGIRTGLWYSLATYPGIFNRLFKYIIFHPKIFFKWIGRLKKMGLIEKSLEKFVQQQMATRTMRAQIYFTWNAFKPFQPDLKHIINEWNRLETPGRLFLGTYDQMVTTQNLSSFYQKIRPLKMVELPCGHNALIGATVQYLQKNS
ncbi:alpha/beta fold hydrolase [Pararhodonellum marinum]|uniref:alpha/beta fold hydrolase n=1 Tax=Pararhodonellum marinum TaxID=2755358 RepID=UPI00188E416B|nr:alpha/beta hydrolase [Pararhodonellum marinum]